MARLHWPPRTFPLLAAATGCFGGFAVLAAAVSGGTTLDFDRELLLLFRAPGVSADPRGPVWLEKAARDITSLGSVVLLGMLMAFAAGFFLLMRRGRLAVFIVVATGGAVFLSRLAKELIDRPRPDLVPHGEMALSASFPSGHALLSAAVYLTVAGMIVRTSQDRRMCRSVLAVAAGLVVFIGGSRVYLGVHWPTDVIAGWLAGAGWASLCLLALNRDFRKTASHTCDPDNVGPDVSKDASGDIDPNELSGGSHTRVAADLDDVASNTGKRPSAALRTAWEADDAPVDPGEVESKTKRLATEHSQETAEDSLPQASIGKS